MEYNISELTDYIKDNHQTLIEKLLNSNERLKLSKHACCKSPKSLSSSISISQFKADEFQIGYSLYIKIVGKLIKYRNELITVIEELNSKKISILLLLHSSFYIDQLYENKNNNLLIMVKEPLCKNIIISNNNKQKIKILIIDNIYYNIILNANMMNNNDEKKDDDDDDDDNINCNILKEKGNKYFKCKQYLFAINCYTKALNKLNNDIDIDLDLKFKLLCNRSLCFIYIDLYSLALIDGNNALKIDNNSFKAKFRCITALNDIGKYLKAIKLLKTINKTDIKSYSIQKKFILLEKEIITKYQESMGILKNDKNEKVDFSLYQSFADNIKWKNVSNFIGPLSIKYMNKKKGRGVVATKNIKSGDIILIEKLFAKGQYKKNNKKHNKKQKCSKQELLLMDILKTTYPNLQRHDFIYYNNSYLLNYKRLSFLCNNKSDNNLKENNIPTMDLYKYNELIMMNDNDNDVLSVNDIKNVVDLNSYESLIDPNDIDLIEKKYGNNDYNNKLIEDKMYLGLWLITSYINHANKPNIYRIIWYNTMILIADKDIKKGEEISLCYLNPFMSEIDKKNQLYQQWGIQ